MSIWDDPELRSGGDYITFANVGDTVSGRVVAVLAHRWDDGSVCPKLVLDCDGEEKTLTAGQVRLKAALAEQRPEAGDGITITLTDIEKRAGGKTLKHFDVKVARGGGVVPAPAAAPAAGGYTAEQLAAMKLLGMETPS